MGDVALCRVTGAAVLVAARLCWWCAALVMRAVLVVRGAGGARRAGGCPAAVPSG
jgi:hypothetical protein